MLFKMSTDSRPLLMIDDTEHFEYKSDMKASLYGSRMILYVGFNLWFSLHFPLNRFPPVRYIKVK